MKFKNTIYDFLYNYKKKSFVVVNDVLAFFTLLSVLGVILETVESLSHYHTTFVIIEIVSVSIFTLEYLGRIWVVDKKLKYIFSLYGFIDFIAIFPSFVGFLNLTFLKSVRVLRILRFLRMMRLAKIIRIKKESTKDLEEHMSFYRLNIQIYFFVLVSAIIIFASLIYVVEPHVSFFSNIPFSMMWSSKVLMGGISPDTPQTIAGNIIMICARFVGLVLLSLLISVVGSTVKNFFQGGDDVKSERKKLKLK